MRTAGRRSGQIREAPMFFLRDGDAIAVVASNAASANPQPFALCTNALSNAVQRKRKSRPVCVSAVTKKNAGSLHLRQRTSLSSGRPALRYPVGRQAVWVARIKRFLPQRAFEQFTTRLFP